MMILLRLWLILSMSAAAPLNSNVDKEALEEDLVTDDIASVDIVNGDGVGNDELHNHREARRVFYSGNIKFSGTTNSFGTHARINIGSSNTLPQEPQNEPESQVCPSDVTAGQDCLCAGINCATGSTCVSGSTCIAGCKSDEMISSECMCGSTKCSMGSVCAAGPTCTPDDRVYDGDGGRLVGGGQTTTTVYSAVCEADKKIVGGACMCDGTSCDVGATCTSGKTCTTAAPGCSWDELSNICSCTRQIETVCAGGISYNNPCLYECCKNKYETETSQEFPKSGKCDT